MKLRFEIRESSFSIVFGMLGVVLTELVWFGAVGFPPKGSVSESVFLASFVLWNIPSFLAIPEATSKKVGYAFLFLFVALSVSYGLGRNIALMMTFASAFPGFFNGALVAGLIILVRRYVLKPSHDHIRWRSVKEDLSSPYLRARYTGLGVVYFALGLVVAYIFVWRASVILYLFLLVALVAVVISGYAANVRKRELHHHKKIPKSNL